MNFFSMFLFKKLKNIKLSLLLPTVTNSFKGEFILLFYVLITKISLLMAHLSSPIIYPSGSDLATPF
jgi:hypothetical protein